MNGDRGAKARKECIRFLFYKINSEAFIKEEIIEKGPICQEKGFVDLFWIGRRFFVLIDTHAHLTGDELWPQINDILDRAQKAGIGKIFAICTSELELKRALSLREKYPWISPIAGTTPHDAATPEDPFYGPVAKAAESKEIIAIGEVGLEYFHPGLDKQLQKQYLIHYFQLAHQTGLPVVFHCRDAFSDLFHLADEHFSKGKALLHCFTGSKEEAKQALDRGWLISISGIATFKKSEALREVIAFLPLDRIVVETDAPYLAPQSKRGKLNEPSYILETYQLIADIKQISLEVLEERVFNNVAQFFSSSKNL